MSNIVDNNKKKTLVYFASGPSKDVYESLSFDRIYLVDNCFIRKGGRNKGIYKPNIKISKSGKVICLGMDCLDAVNYLNKLNVKASTFISLNEGMYEGGGIYPLCADSIISYISLILNDEYIHVMNKNYYGHNGHNYHVTMDLPFLMTEINEWDQDYLDPLLFSDDEYHKGHAKVYRMKKQTSVEYLNINPNIQVSIIHDSIWNYFDELDTLAISITPQGQGDFFKRLPKVISVRGLSVEQILDFCMRNKVVSIGLTPWAHGKYSTFIDQIKNYTEEYPKVISLFHLNRKDYKSVRELV